MDLSIEIIILCVATIGIIIRTMITTIKHNRKSLLMLLCIFILIFAILKLCIKDSEIRKLDIPMKIERLSLEKNYYQKGLIMNNSTKKISSIWKNWNEFSTEKKIAIIIATHSKESPKGVLAITKTWVDSHLNDYLPIAREIMKIKIIKR
ncbi:MAG: hypothetical protein PF549_02660 [Patescibacteria group bacterium]|jgi:hypothetical protein|nr:hypothetical protein [Patescibacteria group bacterium]